MRGERRTTEAELENAQPLAGRKNRQALFDVAFDRIQHGVVAAGAQHLAGELRRRGFPGQQRVDLHRTAEQVHQMDADTAHRVNDLEVLGITAEQFLPDVLGTGPLVLIGQQPGIAAGNQAAVVQRLLK
ncbi:hypothetical protein D3C73_1221460 [compost metagenome]